MIKWNDPRVVSVRKVSGGVYIAIIPGEQDMPISGPLTLEQRDHLDILARRTSHRKRTARGQAAPRDVRDHGGYWGRAADAARLEARRKRIFGLE